MNEEWKIGDVLYTQNIDEVYEIVDFKECESFFKNKEVYYDTCKNCKGEIRIKSPRTGCIYDICKYDYRNLFTKFEEFIKESEFSI